MTHAAFDGRPHRVVRPDPLTLTEAEAMAEARRLQDVAKPESGLEIDDPTVLPFWDGIAAELNKTYLASDVLRLVLEVTRAHFLNVLLSFPRHVVVGVVDTTRRATPTLGVSLGDGFGDHFAGVAKDLMKLLGQEPLPSDTFEQFSLGSSEPLTFRSSPRDDA